MVRESRADRLLREAREHFCASRRDPDHLIRWLAWLRYRTLLEGWDDVDALEPTAAMGLLVEAERWKHGWRPPTSLGQAMATARRRRREGRLRLGSGGL